MLTENTEALSANEAEASICDYGFHVRYDEIALKGENRKMFERQLISNLKEKLSSINGLEVHREYGRILITFNTSPTESEIEFIKTGISKIFGISSFSPVRILSANSNLNTIKNLAIRLVKNKIENDKTESTTFMVRAKRILKSYPIRTREIEIEVGAAIGSTFPHLKVNLSNSDIRIGVDVRQEGIYIYDEVIEGPGGLPVKSLGKVLSLLSGGIDSPVASYLSMKRGCRTYFLYFDSFPYTTKEAQDKVKQLHNELNEFQPKAPLYMVNLAQLQKAVRDNCNERFRTLLYRAIMMKIATRLAHELECLGIVTGEAIGQVASQTLENLNVTDSFTDLLMLRPVSNMDKIEIVNLSKKIGTYETSIIPHSDCCTVFQPERPATRGRVEQIENELKRIPDLEKMIESAITKKETFLN